MDFIIKAMQLSIEHHIINGQAAVFVDLTNIFNLVSREELFEIIDTHFPELTPLTTLIYEAPADVHFKWKTSSWKSIAMQEGVNQGCPLSSTFAALVMNRVLQPIDKLLRQRANERLKNGDPGDDGYGGITHLFAWVDDLSSTIPHIDIKFFLDPRPPETCRQRTRLLHQPRKITYPHIMLRAQHHTRAHRHTPTTRG